MRDQAGVTQVQALHLARYDLHQVDARLVAADDCDERGWHELAGVLRQQLRPLRWVEGGVELVMTTAQAVRILADLWGDLHEFVAGLRAEARPWQLVEHHPLSCVLQRVLGQRSTGVWAVEMVGRHQLAYACRRSEWEDCLRRWLRERYQVMIDFTRGRKRRPRGGR